MARVGRCASGQQSGWMEHYLRTPQAIATMMWRRTNDPGAHHRSSNQDQVRQHSIDVGRQGVPADANRVRATDDKESPKRTILIQETETIPARHDMFNFQSSHASPVSGDVAMGSAEAAAETPPNPMPSVRGDAHPRQFRNISRLSSQNARANTRISTSLGSLAAGAGSKRRIQFGDFFDVSGLSNDRERHGGGGKRTRFT